MLQRRRQGHRLPGKTEKVQKRGLKGQGLPVRGLKIQPYQEEEEGDYEEEEDYDDNLSQENLREMYIAAVDLAIHRVRILSSSEYFYFKNVPVACLL